MERGEEWREQGVGAEWWGEEGCPCVGVCTAGRTEQKIGRLELD